MAVDHTLATPEIYVAQRSAEYPQPILVYDYQGQLLRAWGNGTISFIGGEFGVHGICLQFTPTGKYFDVFECFRIFFGSAVNILNDLTLDEDGDDAL